VASEPGDDVTDRQDNVFRYLDARGDVARPLSGAGRTPLDGVCWSGDDG
jgi:hypothetical protein